jgi:hypothetical protein
MSRSYLVTLTFVVAVLAEPRRADAQNMNPALPPAGTRVRLTLERPIDSYRNGAEPRPEWRTGVLVGVGVDTAANGHTLIVRKADGADSEFVVAHVRRLDVSQAGPCSDRARGVRCTLLGVVGGAGIGLLLAKTAFTSAYGTNICTYTELDECRRNVERKRRTRYAVVFGVIGFWFGGSLGRERWVRVDPWPPADRP